MGSKCWRGNAINRHWPTCRSWFSPRRPNRETARNRKSSARARTWSNRPRPKHCCKLWNPFLARSHPQKWPGKVGEKLLLFPTLSSTKTVEEREQARQRTAAFFPLPATQERGEGQGAGGQGGVRERAIRKK